MANYKLSSLKVLPYKISATETQKLIAVKKDQAVILKSKYKPEPIVQTAPSLDNNAMAQSTANPSANSTVTPDAVIGTPSPEIKESQTSTMVGGAEFQAAPAELAPNPNDEMINPFDLSEQMNNAPIVEEEPALSVEIPTTNVSDVNNDQLDVKTVDNPVTPVSDNISTANTFNNVANVLSDEQFIIELRKLMANSSLRTEPIIQTGLELEAQKALNQVKFLDYQKDKTAEIVTAARDTMKVAQASQQILANNQPVNQPETLSLQQAA